MLRRRAARDEGFTLIELIVTIAIMTIIMSVLVGVVFSYLKVSNETHTRLNESSDQQFASAYWQQDVSSLGLHGAPVNGVLTNTQAIWVGSAPATLPGACASHANTVIAFAWSDYKGVSTTDPTQAWSGASSNAAVYYTKSVTNDNGTTQVQLWRIRCGDTSSDYIMSHYMTAAPTVACDTTCTGSSPYPSTVSLTMQVQDRSNYVSTSTGYTTKLTAERRQG